MAKPPDIFVCNLESCMDPTEITSETATTKQHSIGTGSVGTPDSGIDRYRSCLGSSVPSSDGFASSCCHYPSARKTVTSYPYPNRDCGLSS